jgi:hypothetical protein
VYYTLQTQRGFDPLNTLIDSLKPVPLWSIKLYPSSEDLKPLDQLEDFVSLIPQQNEYNSYTAQCGFEPHNLKTFRRRDYGKRLANANKAKQRSTQKVTRNTQSDWKQKYRKVCHSHMDTVFEETLEPHFGFETIASTSLAFEMLAKYAKVDVPDRILRETEGILLLLVNLTQQSTALGAMTSILTWAQGRTSTSMLKTLKSYLEEILVSPQSSGTPDWINCLRDVRQNWSLCKGNRAFKQISKLLGCLTMLGLCDVSNLSFSIGSFKLFAPELCEKHMSAYDIIDALFETVTFFTEGAYLCFQSGSLRPLLVNDRTAMELDEEYAQVSAWFALVKNGNLHKFAAMSDHEFERRLNTLSTNLRNLSQSLKGPEKKLVIDKFQKILVMQNDFVGMKIASGIRHAPWAIELFGESSQGKTTLGDQLLDAIMTSQGMPIDKKYRCTYNAGDKFMSNWTSDKLVLTFDDVSNEKAAFVERPPTRAIIDACNNQMYYAPKAELDAKAKCFVEPWFVLVNTNKEDMDAYLYSNCPFSVQRRVTVLHVRAKPQFQRMHDGVCCGIDPRKVREFYTKDGVYTPPMFDDIWVIDIKLAVKPDKLDQVASYAPLVWNGKEMTGLSMAECIQWAVVSFDEHRKDQEAMLESMRKRASTMKKCEHEGCLHLKGNCPDHMEEQFGKESVAALWKLWYKTHGILDIKDQVTHAYDRIDHEASLVIYEKGKEYLESWDWIKCIPAPILNHPEAPPIVKWWYKDRLKNDCVKETRRALWTLMFMIIIVLILLPIPAAIFAILILILEFLARQRNLVEQAEDNLFEELKNRNMEIAPMLRRYRDDYAKKICMASIGVAALYGLARAYRAYRKETAQGSLEPTTQQEIDQRDSEVNVWTSVSKRDLPITEYSKRMSTEHMTNCVTKSLVYGTIHLGEENGMMNAMMVASNVMIVPDHYFEEFGDELNCTFRKSNPNASGGKFVARLSKSASYLVPDSDIRVCYVPTGGSFKNLVNCFPTGDMPAVPFCMHWRKKDGDMVIAKGLTDPGLVTTIKTFRGGMYRNLTIDTFDGLCGAAIVSDTNGSVILGIHLGGTAGTPRGCYGSLTQQELFKAFSHLRSLEGVILSGGAGKFETTVLGVQVLKSDPLHKKSPLNYLPENSQIEYFGSCPGRSVTKTSVKVTPISHHIIDVCGVPNIFRGPKLHPEWYGWQTCLANLAIPAHPFPYDLLTLAVRDYKEPLIEIFRKHMWRSARPLTDHENLCGIPGKKFMDAIKLNTSVGFPLTGPKREYVDELEPTEEWPNNRELHKVLMDEIVRIEDCYRNGDRGYPIAKACKKDEILAKDKCRIFYGNALSLTYLIRKYYLPILRVLQMNPLISECAVGINSHGPEWEEFHQHATKFGMDRLFGGDYGKYDQKLPSQLILASLRILIDFARECDYSEEDLAIMEAMTGDIVYAYIAFNGDLIGLTEGTHISGNSLTVIINGICGSLNLRCFFYSEYEPESYEERLKFRDNVAVMTYGDDNIGSVSSDISRFTIKGCSEFLAKYGQVYTMPDKESDLLDFLPAEEFEFLKRFSVYHPKMGCHVGALLDKSIYKSLHCFMRDKNSVDTEEMASAQNMDGALREWFNHGEDKYEKQRGLMKEVANRAGITHLCNGLNLSYNDRVCDWNAQYRPDS